MTKAACVDYIMRAMESLHDMLDVLDDDSNPMPLGDYLSAAYEAQSFLHQAILEGTQMMYGGRDIGS